MAPTLRLTPRVSPAPRTPTTKSPIKLSREEQQCLLLKRIIGSTVASSNAVTHIESTRTFAYTAGAAAVVVTVEDDNVVTQRIFRTKAASSLATNMPAPLDSPIAAHLAQSPRVRASLAPRDFGAGVKTFGSPLNDSVDSPNSRISALREKAKVSSCISLSPDGKWIAVGESGYRPRILIFSLAKESATESPSSSLTEHAFGVKALAFSDDSEYLASLGDINDGFLYVWNINQRTGAVALCAINKCTSNVKAMTWMGNSLVTVGTRHVKVWRMEKNVQASPSRKMSEASFTVASPSKALSGRNCVLGSLLDKIYTAAVAIDTQRAIVCSEEGDICLLVDSDTGQNFAKAASADFQVRSACLVSHQWLLIGGHHGIIKRFDIMQFTEPEKPSNPESTDNMVTGPDTQAGDVMAFASIGTHAFSFDSNRTIESVNVTVGRLETLSPLTVRDRLSTHASAIRGVQAVESKDLSAVAFLTFSADGLILLWDDNGKCISNIKVALEQTDRQEEAQQNELKAVAVSRSGRSLFSGDRHGILKAIDMKSGICAFEVKAHASEIVAIDSCVADDIAFVAAASRDRTIQIFRLHKDEFELVQTLDDHVGAVTSIRFTGSGKRLISCSSDRSILVRNLLAGEIDGSTRIAFIIDRTINLRSTPLSMDICWRNGKETLLISTADKSVMLHNIEDGSMIHTFKAVDEDDNDPVSLNCITHTSLTNGNSTIAGASNTDKSIRLYNENGGLIGRDYGHTEGVTGVTELRPQPDHNDRTLVSVATDGTVLIWKAEFGSDQSKNSIDTADISQGTPKANAFFSPKPPLRRVLSSSELLKLQGLTIGEDSVTRGAERARSRSPKRKLSKLPFQDTPELSQTPPPPDIRERYDAPSAPGSTAAIGRRKTRTRPPSPSSPRRQQQSRMEPRQPRRQSSQPSLSSVHRRKSGGGNSTPNQVSSAAFNFDTNELVASTQQVCRSLHAYRRKLGNSGDPLPVENVRELEKELSQTARALAEKAARSEAVMEKLLDRYGERLVEIMERKIDEKVGRLFDEGANERKMKDTEEGTNDELAPNGGNN